MVSLSSIGRRYCQYNIGSMDSVVLHVKKFKIRGESQLVRMKRYKRWEIRLVWRIDAKQKGKTEKANVSEKVLTRDKNWESNSCVADRAIYLGVSVVKCHDNKWRAHFVRTAVSDIFVERKRYPSQKVSHAITLRGRSFDLLELNTHVTRKGSRCTLTPYNIC